MFNLINLFLFLLLFITCIQCQNLKNNPTNTNVGTCSCNYYNGTCDTACCCDVDCSIEDLKAFNCYSKSNENIDIISSKPATQTTCFKDLSIYKSNSPHFLQKKNDLICVDHEQKIDTKNTNYEKMIDQEIDSSILPRSINIDNSVSLPTGTATNLSNYQAGTSVFRYFITDNSTSYYSLPIKLFNSAACFGYQSITYMNDFTSTCIQPVNSDTCTGILNPARYISNLSLITLPSTLASSAPTYIPCTGSTVGSSTVSGSSCNGLLQIFTLTIFYSNPGGIQNCTISYNNSLSASFTSTVSQTFTVRFVQNGPTTTGISRSGNPGYLQGASIIAGNSNGSSINTISNFNVFQASTAGVCDITNSKSIRFGENIQSTCLSSNNACPNITDSSSIFTPYTLSDLYVAAYGNPNPSNITGYWLRVQFCVSQIGSSTAPTCSNTSVPNISSVQCYTRQDIQITYANVGSVTNPQPILGAVVFYYQGLATAPSTPIFITQTVTFQDVSNPPTTGGNQIPRPNTRIPGDFFYPFTLNRATPSVAFSLICNLLIIFALFFM